MAPDKKHIAQIMASLLSGRLEASADEVRKAKKLANRILQVAAAQDLESSPIEQEFAKLREERIWLTCPAWLIKLTKDDEYVQFDGVSLKALFSGLFHQWRLDVTDTSWLAREIHRFYSDYPQLRTLLCDDALTSRETEQFLTSPLPKNEGRSNVRKVQIEEFLRAKIPFDQLARTAHWFSRWLSSHDEKRNSIETRIKRMKGGEKGGRKKSSQSFTKRDESRLDRAAQGSNPD